MLRVAAQAVAGVAVVEMARSARVHRAGVVTSTADVSVRAHVLATAAAARKHGVPAVRGVLNVETQSGFVLSFSLTLLPPLFEEPRVLAQQIVLVAAHLAHRRRPLRIPRVLAGVATAMAKSAAAAAASRTGVSWEVIWARNSAPVEALFAAQAQRRCLTRAAPAHTRRAQRLLSVGVLRNPSCSGRRTCGSALLFVTPT